MARPSGVPSGSSDDPPVRTIVTLSTPMPAARPGHRREIIVTMPPPKTKKPKDKTLETLVSIFKSLADIHRLKILITLMKHQELHVSAICEELDQSQPAVSHHLTQLKHAKLVDFRRDGKFNYYHLDSEEVRELILKFYPAATGSQQKLTFGDLEMTFKIK